MEQKQYKELSMKVTSHKGYAIYNKIIEITDGRPEGIGFLSNSNSSDRDIRSINYVTFENADASRKPLHLEMNKDISGLNLTVRTDFGHYDGKTFISAAGEKVIRLEDGLHVVVDKVLKPIKKYYIFNNGGRDVYVAKSEREQSFWDHLSVAFVAFGNGQRGTAFEDIGIALMRYSQSSKERIDKKSKTNE